MEDPARSVALYTLSGCLVALTALRVLQYFDDRHDHADTINFNRFCNENPFVPAHNGLPREGVMVFDQESETQKEACQE